MLVPLPAGVDPAAAASASDNMTDTWRTVAGDPSLTPIRRLGHRPSAGSKTAVLAVRIRPMMPVSAWSPAARAEMASMAL